MLGDLYNFLQMEKNVLMDLTASENWLRFLKLDKA